MTALVLSLVRALPAPVKARLRGDGRHRAPGRPYLVNTRLTVGKHRQPTALEELDGWRDGR